MNTSTTHELHRRHTNYITTRCPAPLSKNEMQRLHQDTQDATHELHRRHTNCIDDTQDATPTSRHARRNTLRQVHHPQHFFFPRSFLHQIPFSIANKASPPRPPPRPRRRPPSPSPPPGAINPRYAPLPHSPLPTEPCPTPPCLTTSSLANHFCESRLFQLQI